MSVDNDFVLMTDSCCDLPAEITAKLGAVVLPLPVNTDYPARGADARAHVIDVPGFYRRLRTGMVAFTSAVSRSDFEGAMRPLLESGRDILYIGFSSALSLTYSNALLAASGLEKNYPGRTIVCIDSRSASMGEGLLVCLAAQSRESGAGLAGTAAHIKDLIPHICHWFTVDNLRLLKRGGRMNATLAVAGAVMHMKPLMHVDGEGRLVNTAKVRGRESVIRAMLDKLDTAEDIASQTVMISHGDCRGDAESLEAMIREKYHPADVVVNTVGPVVGAHCGPGTLALFFIGTER